MWALANTLRDEVKACTPTERTQGWAMGGTDTATLYTNEERNLPKGARLPGVCYTVDDCVTCLHGPCLAQGLAERKLACLHRYLMPPLTVRLIGCWQRHVPYIGLAQSRVISLQNGSLGYKIYKIILNYLHNCSISRANTCNV